MIDIRTRVVELLDGLGSSSYDVAQTLTGAGIKGLTRDPYACPVFTYLRREGCAVNSVVLGEVWLTGSTRVALPAPVREFVHRFDDGEFPGLEVSR